MSGRSEGPKRLGLTMAHLQTTSDMAMVLFMCNMSETDPTALLTFYKNLFYNTCIFIRYTKCIIVMNM